MNHAKYNLFIYSLIILSYGFSSNCKAELPAGYQLQLAQEKQAVLWENISREPYFDLPISNPSFCSVLSLFNPYFLVPTFTHVSDEMPEGRLKLIHTYGSSGMIELVADKSSPFSGLFQQNSFGILRVSLAKQSAPEENAFTPGLALKLLVDGQPSENIVAMYSLDGQGNDKNFFSKPFSTKIDPPKSKLLRTLSKAFSYALTWLGKKSPDNERTMPLERMASLTPQGVKLPSQEIRFPYQLLFRPTEAIKAIYAEKLLSHGIQTDFRTLLSTIEKGTIVYQIYGKADPNSSDEYFIGNIVLNSQFVASEYGDQQLFFQHPMKLE